MYADDNKRSVPKTLNECIENGKVERDLWRWSELMEVIGVVLLFLIVVGGFFVSFSISTELRGDYSIGPEFFILLFVCVVIGLVQYISFRIIALLIGAQASVVENTRISANIAMYKAAQAEETKTE